MNAAEKLELFESSLNLMFLRDVVAANNEAGRNSYDGLSSAQIGRLNRAAMFGDNDEAFPSDDEWSRIVD